MTATLTKICREISAERCTASARQHIYLKTIVGKKWMITVQYEVSIMTVL